MESLKIKVERNPEQKKRTKTAIPGANSSQTYLNTHANDPFRPVIAMFMIRRMNRHRVHENYNKCV